jgi:hypothetical protein
MRRGIVNTTRIEQQQTALSAILALHEGVQLAGYRPQANSLLNRFVIVHEPTGVSFSVDAMHATDFHGRRFQELFKDFLAYCAKAGPQAAAGSHEEGAI